jgi:hypothetical protein
MTTPVPPVPAEPAAPVPAPSRLALRAYLLGLVAAVLAAVVPLAQASLGDVHWSAAWWTAVGIALVVPALTAALHYLAEHKFPPGS